MVDNNTASGNPSSNTGGRGGGVYAEPGSQLTIDGADITQNNVYNLFGSAQGGGLHVAVSPAQQIGDAVGGGSAERGKTVALERHHNYG